LVQLQGPFTLEYLA